MGILEKDFESIKKEIPTIEEGIIPPNGEKKR